MKEPRKKIGRPLSFDRAAALERAMHAFWRHGYETTSVAELTSAMGVTAPSLYAAFGDKQALFLEAMRLYAGDSAAIGAALAAAPSARDGIAAMLRASACAFTDAATPPGCLLASATASGSRAAAPVQAAVAAVRGEVGQIVRRRIEADRSTGRLPVATDAQALADLAIGVIQGMSVLARDGVPRARLLALAEQAVAAFPAG
ncbi:TetR/AcrR family transcriptional regulator [Massilia sp. DWR3-1-1]|uniref:TetR/AcrR family transcriptional regulator n=1 Tax=Massilia sp. DWR3-1-1 TaxID=2804559 RepID=UPI003CF9B7E1